jgi:hypothetical protein
VSARAVIRLAGDTLGKLGLRFRFGGAGANAVEVLFFS